MPYWNEFLIVAGIHLLAVASPGPDFAMISRSALVYSRRAGVWAALGLSLGISVHVIYCLLGIGLLISQSILAFSVIKYLGAAYLVYIGVQAIRAKAPTSANPIETRTRDIAPAAAVRMGFLTNVLNPKATLFFLSVFTQVIDPATPVLMRALFGIEMAGATFLWFSMIALVLSQETVRRQAQRFQHYVERAFGAVLIALGLKVATSH